MKKFMEFVSANPAAFPMLGEMTKEEIIAAATAKGFELTEDDFAKQRCELNDDELAAVAGGENDCLCAAGGGGVADSNDKTCACVLDGAGKAKNGEGRCVCIMAGHGEDT